MWHTHQLETRAYISDCITYLRKVINHDDTDTDHGPNSKLTTSFIKTCQLWRKTFTAQKYDIHGVMNRGHFSENNCFDTKFNHIRQGQHLAIKVDIRDVTLVGANVASQTGWKVELYCNKKIQATFLIKEQENETHTNLVSFTVNPKPSEQYTLLFRSAVKIGTICRRFFLEFEHNLSETITTTSSKSNRVSLPMLQAAEKKANNKVWLDVTYYFSLVSTKRISMQIETGSFVNEIMPENVEIFWGPVPFSKISELADKTASVSVHRLVQAQQLQQLKLF
jgi:hypothetical protein